MPIKVIRNGEYLPHQAVILTKQNNLSDFRFDKIIMAYKDRINKQLGCPVWETEVHPVDFCSLGCKGCSYAERHSGNKINVVNLVKILKYYEKFDLKTVFFSGGGDPCGWKEWKQFIDLVGDRNWKLGISTNLFDLSNIKSIIQEFEFYQVHVVGYDRNSVIAEAGVDAFDKLKSNYNELMLGKKDSQCITMKILLRNENYKNIGRFLSFMEQFDCNTIVIKMEQNFLANDKNNGEIQLEEVRKAILGHSIINKFEYCLDNLEDAVFNLPLPKQCYIANSGLYSLIRADGSIFPCVAGTYDIRNSYAHIEKIGEYNYKKMEEGFYDKIMKTQRCPIGACRHYRFNSIIERYKEGQSFSKLNQEPILL